MYNDRLMICFFFVMFFFFQAEDGIRDLVRSRGLGDVYKRQDLGLDTSSYSFQYLTHWSEGMDDKKFAAVVSMAITQAKHIAQDFRNYAGLTAQIENDQDESPEEGERKAA